MSSAPLGCSLCTTLSLTSAMPAGHCRCPDLLPKASFRVLVVPLYCLTSLIFVRFLQLRQCCIYGWPLISRYLISKLWKLLFCLENQLSAWLIASAFSLRCLSESALAAASWLFSFFLFLSFESPVDASDVCCLPVPLSMADTLQYAVGVYVKWYFNLWYSPRCWWNAIQDKPAYCPVVPGHSRSPARCGFHTGWLSAAVL